MLGMIIISWARAMIAEIIAKTIAKDNQYCTSVSSVGTKLAS